MGRFSRTAFLAFVVAGIGNDLFDDVADPWLTAVRFVLVILGTSALSAELTRQAQRAPEGASAGWSRTDTGNVLILLGYAALLVLVLVIRDLAAGERAAATCFLVLYVVLPGYFGWTRRKALRARE
ncbi:hypothetical protein [Actinoplanes sp. NPDC049681]|uniref:hypothetical protein n=1 Tax=Actinoplanes sp. NPDC049681 TaxID=3363905 RepID=UPI00378B0929